MNLKEIHEQYQKRLIDWTAIEADAIEHDTPYCEKCGCLGNNQCGHEPLFIDCSLTLVGYCNCCSVLEALDGKELS